MFVRSRSPTPTTSALLMERAMFPSLKMSTPTIVQDVVERAVPETLGSELPPGLSEMMGSRSQRPPSQALLLPVLTL